MVLIERFISGLKNHINVKTCQSRQFVAPLWERCRCNSARTNCRARGHGRRASRVNAGRNGLLLGLSVSRLQIIKTSQLLTRTDLCATLCWALTRLFDSALLWREKKAALTVELQTCKRASEGSCDVCCACVQIQCDIVTCTALAITLETQV
jgi:hypothetical protein